MPEPYRPRPISFLRQVQLNGWTLKLYGISAHRSEPPDSLVQAAMAPAPSALPEIGDGVPTPAIGCVWELAVTDFERRAWLSHVLADSDGPDLEGYAAQQLNATV